MKQTVSFLLLFISSMLSAEPGHATSYGATLEHLYDRYVALPKSEDIGPLFQLDRELRSLVDEIHKNVSAQQIPSLYKSKYALIGLEIGHYSETIEYSGKLLVEAHRINPNSKYRKYTLFTEILGETPSHGLGEMPNIERAKQYLREYPMGPYAGDTHVFLGGFYSDLYQVLKGLIENPGGERDYKYDCYSKYITSEPFKVQAPKAQSLAIENFRNAKALGSSAKMAESMDSAIDSLKRGDVESWYWCGD